MATGSSLARRGRALHSHGGNFTELTRRMLMAANTLTDLEIVRSSSSDLLWWGLIGEFGTLS